MSSEKMRSALITSASCQSSNSWTLRAFSEFISSRGRTDTYGRVLNRDSAVRFVITSTIIKVSGTKMLLPSRWRAGIDR